jgi:ribosome biogenesis protein Nip4
MKRLINLAQKLKTFEGKTIKTSEQDSSPFPIKTALLTYVRNADRMGISQDEVSVAYQVGCKIGVSENSIELSTKEYDLLKKLVDKNYIKIPNGEQEPLYGVEIAFQLKEVVDSAEIIKEKK